MKFNIPVLVFVVLLGACVTPERTQQAAPAVIPETADFPVLAGDWILVALEGDEWAGEPAVTMNLSADGRFAGSGGCNRYFGVFNAKEGKLETGPIGSTMMACEQGAMDLERRYLGMLENVTRISRVDDLLHLLDEQGRELLTLRRAP